MARNEKRIEDSGLDADETMVSDGEFADSIELAAGSTQIAPQQDWERRPTWRDFDEAFVRLGKNIAAEQKAMNALLVRLRKRAG